MTRACELMKALKAARCKWNLSQDELAELAGRSVSALQHSEGNGKPKISAEALCDFADALGFDVVLKFRGKD